ncbi:MAG: hypothetical protein ACI8XO_002535 [Verrucomicrobiales bacterium]|jgi:hypothetical protein
MFRPPNQLWALVFVCVVLALPLPPVERSLADQDGGALQPRLGAQPAADEVAGDRAPIEGGEAVAPVSATDLAALEDRILARVRHQMHGEVDDLALRSMEQAMRRLRDREGEAAPRPLGKVLRLTFELEPEIAGIAPVSVLTRRTDYSAFADTVLGGTSFRLNIAGDLSLKGLYQEKLVLDFSTLLQFSDRGNNESGSSGASGSAEVMIGESEVLMSVGARDLVLTVSEVR